MAYIFGPVKSRRLGYSLGIEIVPEKICSYNCVYCEAGKTVTLTTDLASYVNRETLDGELFMRMHGKMNFDWFTITGMGEPTLNKDIGTIIRELSLFNVPICVLTNGSLLHRPEVRAALADATRVIPSLDTAIEETFSRLNVPANGITLSNVIEGIRAFSHEFEGELWIEIIVVKGYNDTRKEMEAILAELKTMRVDKVYVGTVYRPPAFAVEGVDEETLTALKKVIADAGYVVI